MGLFGWNTAWSNIFGEALQSATYTHTGEVTVTNGVASSMKTTASISVLVQPIESSVATEKGGRKVIGDVIINFRKDALSTHPKVNDTVTVGSDIWRVERVRTDASSTRWMLDCRKV